MRDNGPIVYYCSRLAEWSLFLFDKKSCEPKNGIKKNYGFCTKTILYSCTVLCLQIQRGRLFLIFTRVNKRNKQFFSSKNHIYTHGNLSHENGMCPMSYWLLLVCFFSILLYILKRNI